MILKANDYDIFNSPVVAETRIDGINLVIFANDIIFVQIGKYQTLEVKVYEAGVKFISTFGIEKRYHFIFQFQNFGDVSPELRTQRAKSDGSKFSLSDAIVISNISQKLIADFYMRINKPKRPTRVFTSVKKALQWTVSRQIVT